MKGSKTGGRQKGTPNKATAEIKETARQYAADAMAELARIMRKSSSDAARIAACREILDRAYGKAPQGMAGEGGEGRQRIEVSWSDGGASCFDAFLKEAAETAT